MKLEKAVPNLPVDNVPESIRHYCEMLGFTLEWDDTATGSTEIRYACLSRDEFTICLTAHPTLGKPAELWCYVDDAADLFKEFSSRGLEMSKGLEKMPWGEIELNYVDPDGNRICFTQRAPSG